MNNQDDILSFYKINLRLSPDKLPLSLALVTAPFNLIQNIISITKHVHIVKEEKTAQNLSGFLQPD